jgi:hypothetical protein
MSRAEKVKLLIKLIEEIEGIELDPSHFKEYTDKELDGDLDWYDYLLDK